jgi:hypothetical protein
LLLTTSADGKLARAMTRSYRECAADTGRTDGVAALIALKESARQSSADVAADGDDERVYRWGVRA